MNTKLSFLTLSAFLLLAACGSEEAETNVTEKASSVVESTVAKVEETIDATVETASEAAAETTAVAEEVVEESVEAVSEVTEEVTEQAQSIVTDATTAVTEAVEEVKEQVIETTAPAPTGGAEHVVNAKGLTAFDKPILYIAPGDTVHFKKLNGGHNSESVFVPEGAEGWAGAMNKNISVTLTVPGFYGYLCLPHAGLGMNGVIVVGDAGDKTVIMDKLRALDSKDFSRKLLGKLNKVDPALYVK